MFKRITQCPHFPNRIKHVTFIIAVLILTLGFYFDEMYVDNRRLVFWVTPSIIIFFFLWKTNYFTRNKK